MKRILSLVMLICALACNKAMAEVQIFVHIPVESTGNLDPAKAPYIWSQDETFGAYPGQKMTNNCKVNDVMYFYATIPNVSSATFKINNGDPVEKDNCTEQKQVSAAYGSVNLNKYYFWDIDAPTQLTEYYPTKVYVGAPLTKNDDNTWTDPSADDNVYVWFDDVVNSDLTHGVCGTDNYPAMPGVKVSNLPVEEIFGVKRHYFIYKHHTDNSPVLKFTNGNKTDPVATEEIPVQDGYCYTYTYTVDDDTNITGITAAAGTEVMLEINETNFPDANFRKYIDDNYDVTNNNKLTSREINDIRNINLRNKNVTNLKGLEFFTEVRILNVSGNSIGEDGLWMLPELNNLLILQASTCGLKILSLPNHPSLQIVEVENNGFTSLDFSHCPSLREFNAYACESLTSLDMTDCSFLEKINLQNCKGLKEQLCGASSPLKDKSNMKDLNINFIGVDERFDFSAYTTLEKIAAHGSDFSRVDFSQNDVLPCYDTLKTIHMQGCQISAFPFSNYPALEEIKFYQNLMTTVDFSGNHCLVDVGINSNNLDMNKLDMTPSKNTLKYLHADLNYNIRGIDVTGCTVLEQLFVHRNALDKLDVTTCSSLKVLNCSEQERDGVRSLKSLDLSGNPVLERLDCARNDFTELDVTPCKATLQHLDFSDNKVGRDNFVYTDCNNLRNLYTGKNPQLGDVNTNNMTYLSNYSCNETGITRLDVSANKNLQTLALYDNTELDELILPDYSENIGNMGKPNRKGITQLNCYNCNLSTLDLRGNPVDGAFRVYDNRFTHLDLTDYVISKGNNNWNYTRLNAQYPILPAVVVVENDENENDIVYYYTVEMPKGFDRTRATLDDTCTDKVSWLIDEVNNKTYLKLPKEPMTLYQISGRDHHFTYTYEVPLNSGTPEYNNRNVVSMHVKIIYPESKFTFKGEHHSTFNPTSQKNEYTNKINITPNTWLESDLGVVYKLKRFKLKTVVDEDNPDGKLHEHFDENVASMMYEKINPAGEFKPENLQWRVKIGDADDPNNTKAWSDPRPITGEGSNFTFDDELSYSIVDPIDWYNYRYNVVRDLNGAPFDVPVYSGTTRAEYVKHTYEDVLDDKYHTLALPSLANVNIEHDVEGATLTYSVNQGAAASANADGQVDASPQQDHAISTVHGLINTTKTNSQGEYTNTYGATPANLQTYLLDAQVRSKYKAESTYNNGSRYFWYNLDVNLGDEGANAECLGFRVWQTLPEEDRDDFYPVLNERTNDFCIFDNVSEDNSDLTVEDGIGTQEIWKNIDGINRSLYISRFGSKNPTPEISVRVRAYYRVTPVGGPKSAPANGGMEPAGQYLVAEEIIPIKFDSDVNVATAVDEVLSEIPVMVRYLDLNGRVSDRPFGGATLKIITHANGKVTKQLLK